MMKALKLKVIKSQNLSMLQMLKLKLSGQNSMPKLLKEEALLTSSLLEEVQKEEQSKPQPQPAKLKLKKLARKMTKRSNNQRKLLKNQLKNQSKNLQKMTSMEEWEDYSIFDPNHIQIILLYPHLSFFIPTSFSFYLFRLFPKNYLLINIQSTSSRSSIYSFLQYIIYIYSQSYQMQIIYSQEKRIFTKLIQILIRNKNKTIN